MLDMTITFKLEPSDMLAFQNYARKHLSIWKRMRYIILVLFGGLSLLIAVTTEGASGAVRIAMFIEVFLILWIVYWILEFVLRKTVFWRSYTSDKHRSVLCEHTVTLTDDAFVDVTAFTESRHRWNGIYQVIDATDYVYVFTTQHIAHIVPKRAFTDVESARRFYEQAAKLHAAATRAA